MLFKITCPDRIPWILYVTNGVTQLQYSENKDRGGGPYRPVKKKNENSSKEDVSPFHCLSSSSLKLEGDLQTHTPVLLGKCFYLNYDTYC